MKARELWYRALAWQGVLSGCARLGGLHPAAGGARQAGGVWPGSMAGPPERAGTFRSTAGCVHIGSRYMAPESCLT